MISLVVLLSVGALGLSIYSLYRVNSQVEMVEETMADVEDAIDRLDEVFGEEEE